MKRRAKARPGIKPLIEIFGFVGVIGLLTLAVATIGTIAAGNAGNRMDPRKEAIMNQALTLARDVAPEASPSSSDAVPDAHQTCRRRAGNQPRSVWIPSCRAGERIPCDNPVERHAQQQALVVYAGSETADATQG
jgi:hypothetical protein